jgi:hypothetical protein
MFIVIPIEQGGLPKKKLLKIELVIYDGNFDQKKS